MTALIDVDRIVDEFLRDRARAAAGHGDVPAHRLPAGACPPGCRLTPGHPYMAERPTGLQSRYHESSLGAARDLGRDGRLEARLVADEYRTPTGRSTLAEARIVVEGPLADGLEELDAEQARALAALLIRAADGLEGRVLRAA